MITDLQAIMVRAEDCLRRVMKVIDDGGNQIALVVDDEGRLVATVTDGDVRRGILEGVGLESPVSVVMHRDPTTLPNGTSAATSQRLMSELELNHIPVIDHEGRLVSLAVRKSMMDVVPRSTPVVLMVGGLGMRLRPLTETLPKPMIPINGKPLLERIVTRFRDQGFSQFTLSLNYLGHLIRSHFGDGSALGVSISYVEESQRMGNALSR